MAQTVIPVAVDTKTLTAMTGLSRQRLDKLRKDTHSGFPKPSRIGRSVRYIVEEVMQWLEARRGCTSVVLKKTVQMKHAVVANTTPSQIQPVHLAHKTKPTVAEVKEASAKALAATPKNGQRCIGNLIETAEGVAAKYYQLIPRHPNDPRALSCTHKVVHHQTYLMGRKSVAEFKAANAPSQYINADQVDHSALVPATSHPSESVTHSPSAVSPNTLKRDYEEGLSLDALCTRHRIGKSKASKLLREAGANVRKPGRTKVASRKTDIATVNSRQVANPSIANAGEGATK